MATEIAFERLALALEATRGTPESAPTHTLNLKGTLTPNKFVYHPERHNGTLSMHADNDSTVTRTGSAFEGEGAVSVNELPVWLNMALAPVTSPSTPGGATLTRLWEFVRSMTTDDLETATVWWGDPNVQVFSGDFLIIQEITFTNDATSEDGVLMMSVSGMAGEVSSVADPTYPAMLAGSTLPGMAMQLWVDTATIGTTAITGRLLTAEHTIRTGIVPKFVAVGPSGAKDYAIIGRQKVVGMTTRLTMELPDLTQYDQWVANTALKVRVRHSGLTPIEGAFYPYVEFDAYGPFESLAWGENQGTNRTIELTIESGYNPTLASDARVAVQNARTSL